MQRDAGVDEDLLDCVRNLPEAVKRHTLLLCRDVVGVCRLWDRLAIQLRLRWLWVLKLRSIAILRLHLPTRFDKNFFDMMA
jgi:hypothetical protein